MNIFDEKLVLIKQIGRNNCKSYKIKEIILVDVDSNEKFNFKPSQLVELIESKALTPSNAIKIDELAVELPEASNFIKKTSRCKNLRNINKEKKIITRKLEYLNHLAEVGVTGFSPKSLNPIIKTVAKKINDDSPPTWRTLIRWAKKYTNNNENADSLTDNRLNNMPPKIQLEVLDLIEKWQMKWKQSPDLKFKTRIKKGELSASAC